MASAQAVLDALAALTAATQALLAKANADTPGEKSLIQKPTPYNGKSSPDARRFLAAFHLYAGEAGSKLNDRRTPTPDNPSPWAANHQKWIKTALSFLQDDAAVWATPYIEKLVNGEPAFNTWQEFCTAFRLRFETQDESADAKEALRKLYQGKLSVPEYVARFREVMSRTGYSDGDLRDRFYEHLSTEVKDLLPTTERSTKTLDELITVATDFDTRLRQRKAEKAREQGRTTGTTFTTRSTPVSAAPFATPAKDPNAMDIDASKGNGKTRNDFLKAMQGRCFGCGSRGTLRRTEDTSVTYAITVEEEATRPTCA